MKVYKECIVDDDVGDRKKTVKVCCIVDNARYKSTYTGVKLNLLHFKRYSRKGKEVVVRSFKTTNFEGGQNKIYLVHIMLNARTRMKKAQTL